MFDRNRSWTVDRSLSVVFLGCALVLAFSPPLYAQAAPASGPARVIGSSSPTAPASERILSRYIEAVGGRAAWGKLNSRVSTGRVKVMGSNMTGKIEIREKAPNRMLTVITLGDTSFRQGYDGKTGWTEDPQNGLREQSGAELAETRRQADFYGALNFRDHYTKFAVIGSEKVDGHDAFVLEATAAGDSDPDKIYFDTQSGLPIRILGHHHSPAGVTWFVEDFGDYREIDGVKLPFSIAQTSMDAEFSVEISEVHHNILLEDSQFAKPAVQ